MSTVTTTGTLVPGTAVALRAPAADASQQIAAVIVQNLSGYQLAVNIGADSYVLPPYMADVYQLTAYAAAVVQILPTDPQSSPAGVPAYANATWLGGDELPDASSYPATIPAPAFAVGLVIAEQLLAQGVPSVSVVDYLGSFTLGTTATLDVSKYASVIIENTNSSQPITIQQFMVAGDATSLIDEYVWNGGPKYLTKQINCYGLSLDIACGLDPTTVVKVWGSNRSIVAPGDSANELILAGTAAGVLAGANLVSVPTFPAGKYTIHFSSSSAVTTGYFSVHDNFGNVLVICETQEMAAGSSASGKVLLKTSVALPADANIWYNCSGAAGGTVAVAMVAEP